MTVGERIAARRKALKMTQEELAKKMGYKSKSSINKIELEWANIPLSKLEKIAAALDCDPAYLMGWDIDVDEAIRFTPSLEAVIAPENIIQNAIDRGMQAKKLTFDDLSQIIHVQPSELMELYDGNEDAITDDEAQILAISLGCDYRELKPTSPRPGFYLQKRRLGELTDIEKDLVSAWRSATIRDRKKVAIDLEDYGFLYSPEE